MRLNAQHTSPRSHARGGPDGGSPMQLAGAAVRAPRLLRDSPPGEGRPSPGGPGAAPTTAVQRVQRLVQRKQERDAWKMERRHLDAVRGAEELALSAGGEELARRPPAGRMRGGKGEWALDMTPDQRWQLLTDSFASNDLENDGTVPNAVFVKTLSRLDLYLGEVRPVRASYCGSCGARPVCGCLPRAAAPRTRRSSCSASTSAQTRCNALHSVLATSQRAVRRSDSAPILMSARAHQGRIGRSNYVAFLKNIRRLIFLSGAPAQPAAGAGQNRLQQNRLQQNSHQAAAARLDSLENAGQHSHKDLHAATTVTWREHHGAVTQGPGDAGVVGAGGGCWSCGYGGGCLVG